MTARFASLALITLLLASVLIPTGIVLLAGLFGEIFPARWHQLQLSSLLSASRSPAVRGAIAQSLWLAAASSLFATSLAYVHCCARAMAGRNATSRASSLATVPIFFPDVVWALGLLLLIRHQVVQPGRALTLLVHVVFNCALALALVSRLFTDDIQHLVDAARDFSMSLRATASALFRELAPGLLATIALTFAFSFDDFVLTYMLRTPDVETVPLLLYGRWKFGASGEVVAVASMAALLSLSLVASAFLITVGAESKKQKGENHG